MKSNQMLVQTVLKAVSVGLAVACYALGYLDVIDAGTQVNLLAFGLFALSIAALQKTHNE